MKRTILFACTIGKSIAVLLLLPFCGLFFFLFALSFRCFTQIAGRTTLQLFGIQAKWLDEMARDHAEKVLGAKSKASKAQALYVKIDPCLIIKTNPEKPDAKLPIQ